MSRSAAKLEDVSIAVFGLLVDLDDAATGQLVGAALANAQVLDRTKAIAEHRLAEPGVVVAWVKQARRAMEDRNRVLHSVWRTDFDHATEQESLVRRRLAKSSVWDMERNATVENMVEVANTLMYRRRQGE